MENLQENLIQNNEFSDFVDELNEGGLDDDSFMATYSHAANNSEDDERYIKTIFNKFAEQAWDQSGKPIKDKKALSKRGATKFSKEVLENWKKLAADEIDSYI
tara:strand:+ start:274 stop:582 length:309 start_codon:yes stop_codon:yes gene_type:complete